MNIAKIEKNSIANGPGIRVVLWCQGCSVHCKGCHNECTWEPDGGRPFEDRDLLDIIEELKKPWVQGLTLSGGHPLEDYNIDECIRIASMVRYECPNKDIWLYTGFILSVEDFYKPDKIGHLLRLCDVVVDGPYLEHLKDIRLPYCGSSNQRVIDVLQTHVQNKIVIL